MVNLRFENCHYVFGELIDHLQNTTFWIVATIEKGVFCKWSIASKYRFFASALLVVSWSVFFQLLHVIKRRFSDDFIYLFKLKVKIYLLIL
jgi:hypothetical protein